MARPCSRPCVARDCRTPPLTSRASSHWMQSSRLTPFPSPPRARPTLLGLLHDAGQALLQRLAGLLRGGIARQSVVELFLHLERHVPVVLRHRPRRSVIKKNVF